MSRNRGRRRPRPEDGPDRLGLRAELQTLDERALRRQLIELETPQGVRVRVGDRELINLSSNDYLGLAAHPLVRDAAAHGARTWGGGAGASRLVTGNLALHSSAEAELAGLVGLPAARLFGSGYLANVGLLTAVAGAGDAIFSDARNHASIIDGCRLSRAEVRVFAHNDAADLDRWLAASEARRKIVVVEGLFSMDGDLADLPAILERVRAHGAFLVIDEAHAVGVLGPRGGGALEHFGLDASSGDVAVVGTLGKALGSYGAFIAGPSVLCEYLVSAGRTLMFSTAPPPAAVAAARAALVLAEREPWRRERALAVAASLRDTLRELGLDVPEAEGPVVPAIVGPAAEAVALSDRLLREGLLVRVFRPPTVPERASRLRLAASAAMDGPLLEEALDRLRRGFD